MNRELKDNLQAIFKDIEVDFLEDARMVVVAKKPQVHSILRFLKDSGYDHLSLISCVDWIEEGEFELVYIVTRYLHRDEDPSDREKFHIILKARIPREDPKIDTIIPIFRNAEPYERELHELFGIKFNGHPRLTRLFLERDYEVPPFRKDFDTRKYVKEFFDRIPFVEEEKNEGA